MDIYTFHFNPYASFTKAYWVKANGTYWANAYHPKWTTEQARKNNIINDLNKVKGNIALFICTKEQKPTYTKMMTKIGLDKHLIFSAGPIKNRNYSDKAPRNNIYLYKIPEEGIPEVDYHEHE